MDDVIVNTGQGQLRGKTGTDRLGKTFYSFQGIPYAKPPLGNLRFKAPQPPEPWAGVRDATQEGAECYSKHLVFQKVVGSEDCLFINVYTPNLPSKSKGPSKPVMVFIHGGGFTMGSSKTETYGPEFLVAEDVVLVTLNYRLGMLGFLSLEDTSLGVPGNAGLKDMVLALQWVQKNIANFMGDPKNVTIFGESAGGAAVHLLMLSPMAQGLFHRVIAQSGCALNNWARGTRCTKDIAKALGTDTRNEKEILASLRALPVEKLYETQTKIKDGEDACEIRPFGPVVERSSQEAAFLPESPANLIASGVYNHVPLLIGYTSREGMLHAIMSKEKNNGEVVPITDFENTVPYVLDVKKGTDFSKQTANKIKEFYFGTEEPTTKNLDRFYLLNSDNHFVRDIQVCVKKHIRTASSPIYLYRFGVESTLNLYKNIGQLTNPGVCHADDIGYLFKTMFTPEIQPKSIEDVSLTTVTKLWTTFARTGNPNSKEDFPVEWKPVKEGQLHYMEIGENLTVGVNPDAARMAFWQDIYSL